MLVFFFKKVNNAIILYWRLSSHLYLLILYIYVIIVESNIFNNSIYLCNDIEVNYI